MDVPKLHVIILAGGKGERLFPLSTPEKPKQFLRLFGDKSMLQKTVRRIVSNLPVETISVCTTKEYEEYVFNHLEELRADNYVRIWTETEAKGTANSIVFSLRKHQDEYRAPAEDLFLICPCDHVIQNEGNFKTAIRKIIGQAPVWGNKLVLFGIPARYKEPRFGYFITNHDNEVLKFVEKPTNMEIDYLASHGMPLYWNTGIFLGTNHAFLSQYHKDTEIIPEVSFDTLCLSNRQIPLGDIMGHNADSWGWDDIGNWEGLIRHLAIRRR